MKSPDRTRPGSLQADTGASRPTRPPVRRIGIVRLLQKFSTKTLFLLFVGSAVLLTEAVSAVMNIIMFKTLRWDYVLSAFVVAGTVSVVLSLLVVRLVGTIRQLSQNLERLASTDQLTGANNRRKFDETIREEVIRARRFGRPLSMAVMDIDRFKTVNDTHGHRVGDLVLQTCVVMTASQIRSSDHLFRFAGDEFILVFPETRMEDARGIAERVRGAIGQHDFGVAKSVTVSVGLAEFRPEMAEEDLFRLADQGLYRAKNTGRNRVVVQLVSADGAAEN